MLRAEAGSPVFAVETFYGFKIPIRCQKCEATGPRDRPHHDVDLRKDTALALKLDVELSVSTHGFKIDRPNADLTEKELERLPVSLSADSLCYAGGEFAQHRGAGAKTVAGPARRCNPTHER